MLFRLQPTSREEFERMSNYQILTIFLFTLTFSAACSICTKTRGFRCYYSLHRYPSRFLGQYGECHSTGFILRRAIGTLRLHGQTQGFCEALQAGNRAVVALMLNMLITVYTYIYIYRYEQYIARILSNRGIQAVVLTLPDEFFQSARAQVDIL